MVNSPPMSSVTYYSQHSTLHGISDLHASSSFAGRLSWIMLILLATAASFYGTHGILSHYQQSPLYVNLIINSSLNRFTPDLVVCPFNRFDRIAVERLNIKPDLAEYMQVAYSLKTPYKFQHTYQYMMAKNLTYETELQNFLQLHKWTFSELLDNVSTPCEMIVKYCYATSERPKFHNCCEFARGIITPLGKCYRLPGVLQMHSGYGYGVTVVMDASRDRYVSSMTNLHNEGMAVKLAEQGKAMSDDITFLPVGSHVLMPLRAQRYRFVHYPPKYSCDEEGKNIKKCMDECIFSVAEDTCGCTHVTSATNRYPACTPRQMFLCLYRQTQENSMRVTKQSKLSILRYCRQRCLPPCEYWEYQPTVSYTPFLSPDTVARLGWENSSLGKYVILDMFYERMEYAEIKHVESMTFDQLVSNVGGQLGLWVGASILTVAQLVAFLLSYVKEVAFSCSDKTEPVYANSEVSRVTSHGFGKDYGSGQAIKSTSSDNSEHLL